MQEIHALCQSISAGMDVSRLLSGYATVRVHQDVHRLTEAIRSVDDAIVVVDCRRDTQSGVLELLRQIRDRAPWAPIVGRVGLEYESFGMTVEALEFGMAGVWVAGIEDNPSAIQHVFDHVIVRSIGSILTPGIEQLSNATVRHFLMLCFRYAMQPLSVGEMADRLGVSVRSLARLVGQCELPTAETLLVSSRMLVATRLLLNARRKVTSVAAAMNVRDVRVFRRQLARWAGAAFVRERSFTAYQRELQQWQELLRRPALKCQGITFNE